MRHFVVFLLFSLSLVLLAAPAQSAVHYGALVVVPALDIKAEFQMYWLDDPFESDLKSKYGMDDPPRKNKPAVKSKYGMDDPPRKNKPAVKSRYGSSGPPDGKGKPAAK